MLTTQRNRVSGSGIATLARLPIVQRETAEPPDLNTLTRARQPHRVLSNRIAGSNGMGRGAVALQFTNFIELVRSLQGPYKDLIRSL